MIFEDEDLMVLEETKTTIKTSEPHFFHENDEIYYLDDNPYLVNESC